MHANERMIAFCGAQIIAGDAMTALTGACLTVRGERILAIGEALPGADRIDLPGALICPMFVDAHTHLGDAGAKELGVGLSLQQAVEPPDGLKHRYLASLDAETLVRTMRCGLLDMLHSGVIACGDFREQGLAGVTALRQAGQGLPIRAVALGRMDEIGQADEATIEAQAHAILAEADGLGVRDVAAYPPDLLRRLRQRYPGKIFAAHAAESSAAQADSLHRTGRTQVARALDWQPDLLVHLVHATPEDLHAVARAGVTAVSCPRCNGILGNGFPDLAAWQAAGVRFALGTDNVMFAAPDMLRELDFTSRLARGLTQDPAAIDARALLQAATLNGARGLKLDADLGSLAPGKEASFILFDLDRPHLRHQHDPISAIVHRAGRADIVAIYVRGQLFGY